MTAIVTQHTPVANPSTSPPFIYPLVVPDNQLIPFINQNLYPFYKEAVSKIKDPAKKEMRGRIVSLSLEGFDTGIICLTDTKDVITLRQIPADILNACQKAKNSLEALQQTRKIAEYLATYPIILNYHLKEKHDWLNMVTELWMANNSFMRTYALRHGILQMLRNKEKTIWCVVLKSETIDARVNIDNMFKEYNELLKPIREVLPTRRVKNGKVRFQIELKNLEKIKDKIMNDPEFNAALDFVADAQHDGEELREILYTRIDPLFRKEKLP